MSARAQTVRLTPAQHRTLGGFAKTYGLSEYAMLAPVVDAGLAALVHGAASRTHARQTFPHLAAGHTNNAPVGRQVDRALFTARAQTVRLTPAQHRTLGGFAKTYGLSEYAMLARVVDAGLAALVHGADSGIDAREIVAELASVNTSIVDVERMLDRALFTACAAYCYARSAALGARTNDETITAEINAAYDRQRRLSQEKRR